ncbi:cell division ATP-binding protein FtsE [Aestuariivirga litoralis]|uniref:cell division ATP-binding protein FtsE n=1 Tax=Aestuariivirga litoralis TaxID=2650924 RepID=UPI0018C6B52C|nr:cell division ATP-binding protein FtsE [Aestuariivirga litoralis]MBG1233705.1 cell division ATP-binding protein FtsE [Aestuariivirga litoralis]
MGVIELQDVSLRYAGGPPVLHDVNLDLAQGDLRFLTGPSGAGKSTLLRLLFLALKPDSGIARVFGSDVSRLTPHERALLRRKLGVVFQDFRLLKHMSVFENVALPLRAAGARPETYASDVNDLLDWIGLKSRAHDLPDTLSGGEKQRVAIARAVVTKPQVILADEPTGNVDPAMARRLLRLFLELNRQGTTVLLATHDTELIRRAGGQALHLEAGTLGAA